MTRTFGSLSGLILLALVAVGCGGGGGSGHDGGPYYDSNPGLELVGLWTGTFTDSFGDYTASIEVDADDVVPAGAPGEAFLLWGAESVGLEMVEGEFVEIGSGRYRFAYDTVDPGSGAYRDTVSGTVEFTHADVIEGTFTTTSGTSGEVSFARNDVVTPGEFSGPFALTFSDSISRETWYLGEVEIDRNGNVVPGPGSYLTDDLVGEIDPDANFWPIVDGYVTLTDPATGAFEGVLYFDSPDDTITFTGYLGTDLGVFAGIFEDAIGSGLVSFLPIY